MALGHFLRFERVHLVICEIAFRLLVPNEWKNSGLTLEPAWLEQNPLQGEARPCHILAIRRSENASLSLSKAAASTIDGLTTYFF